MHAAGPVHEMASNPAKFALGGLGLDRACQVWPFHCSLSVALRMNVPLCRCPPTAMHAEAAVQATPLSVPLDPGFGVVRMLHLVPFQVSARVSGVLFCVLP